MPEFIKEAYSKDLFKLYPNKYQFYLFKIFCSNNPYKILNHRLQPLKNTMIIPIIRI